MRGTAAPAGPTLDDALLALRLEPGTEPSNYRLDFAPDRPHVTVGSPDWGAIEMTALGAFGAAHREPGRVVYPSTDRRTAMVYRPGAAGVKEDLVLLDAGAFGDGSFGWTLSVPPDVETRAEQDGSIGLYASELPRDVKVCDARSAELVASARARRTRLVARLPAPVVRDAAGREFGAHYSWHPPLLAVTVPRDEAMAFPIAVDPSIILTTDSDFRVSGNDEGLVRYGGGQAQRDKLAGWHVPSWTAAGSFAPAPGRGEHGTAVYNNFLYVVAGDDFGTPYLSDVLFAAINADGTVGTFTATTGLPVSGRELAGTVAYSGHLYVLGGSNLSGVLNDVLYAKLNDDGTISAGAWQTGPPIPGGRRDFIGAAHDGQLYIVGGESLSGVTTSVLRSAVRADGSLEGWTDTSPLGAFRKGAGIFAHDGHLYAVGGSNGTSNVATAEYARINPDGTLSTWMTTTSLPSPRAHFGAAVAGGYAFAIGGEGATTSVVSAAVLPGGGLGPWTPTTGLTLNTVAPAAVTSNGRLFVTGGEDGTLRHSTVHSGAPQGGATAAWAAGPAISGQRFGNAAVAAGGFVYNLGGLKTGVGIVAYNDVQFAAIQADGSLGAWSTTSSFSEGRSFQAATAHGGYMYLACGDTFGSLHSDVQYAAINPDGTLGAWATATSAYPQPLANLTMLAYSGRLYLLGGSTGLGGGVADVRVSTIDPETGEPGAWSSTTPLPVEQNDHGAAAHAGYVYIVGGGEGPLSTTTANVRYASINSDGTLGSWTSTTALPTPRTRHRCVVFNGRIWSLGGQTLANGADVLSAPINADGSVGAWTATASMPAAREYLGAAAGHGHLYAVAGRNQTVQDGTTTVFTSRATTDGTLGSWSTTSAPGTARRSSTAAAHARFAYVLGGLTGATYLDEARVAPIGADGTLGTWAPTTALPSARAGHATVAHRGFLYLMGARREAAPAGPRTPA